MYNDSILESHHNFTVTIRPDGMIALPPEAFAALDVFPGDKLSFRNIMPAEHAFREVEE